MLHVFKELFPNIPAVTYILELKKILSDCRTIIDIGCGANSPLRFIDAGKKVGLDGDKKTLTVAKKNKTHDQYYFGEAKNLTKMFKTNQFDCCVALDVIEHLPKKGGLKLIKDMEKIARKKLVIFTPNGFLPQNNLVNPLDKHRSGWTADEMKKLGFKVIGMFGPKILKGEGYGLKFRPKIFWGVISEIIQYFYTHSHPESAAAIFCVKEKK